MKFGIQLWNRAFTRPGAKRAAKLVGSLGFDHPRVGLIWDPDLHVSAEINVPALESALAGNPNSTIVELHGVNHQFLTAATGAMSENGRIDQTFAPGAMELVSHWILEHS